MIVDIQGVGALYIIMDTIRRRRVEQEEEAARQRQEEQLHNAINRGRQLLEPLHTEPGVGPRNSQP